MNLLYAGLQDVSVRFTSACQARQKSEARKQRRERELLLAEKVAAEVAAGMAKGKVANAVRPGCWRWQPVICCCVAFSACRLDPLSAGTGRPRRDKAAERNRDSKVRRGGRDRCAAG